MSLEQRCSNPTRKSNRKPLKERNFAIPGICHGGTYLSTQIQEMFPNQEKCEKNHTGNRVWAKGTQTPISSYSGSEMMTRSAVPCIRTCYGGKAT